MASTNKVSDEIMAEMAACFIIRSLAWRGWLEAASSEEASELLPWYTAADARYNKLCVELLAAYDAH